VMQYCYRCGWWVAHVSAALLLSTRGRSEVGWGRMLVERTEVRRQESNAQVVDRF
jgi:hypothetical protein